MRKTDIGRVRSLSIKCLSEVSWHDNARMRQDVREAGGLQTADQFDVKWTPGNAAGISALVETIDGGGRPRKILVDVGWDVDYMDEVFRREGVDRMLAAGEIDFVYVTHEHVDHFWGMPAVVRHRPDVKLLIPSGFSGRSRELLRDSGHTGKVVELGPEAPRVLFPGCASVTFDIPIFLKTRGEQVLYFHVEGRGMVIVTGCCHPGVIGLLEYAQEAFEGFAEFHGIYGGLHISPFEEWGPPQDELLDRLKTFRLQRLACNHCTGVITMEKMLERGIPVVRGSGKHGSRSDLYVGNGDTIVF
ncbi:MAG: MBL fold metallo-hydrolase [Deltaproteobacteria bacterium]|nr:MBL fold metallo-hydrolase [Deltaproteobacteria bacterium]